MHVKRTRISSFEFRSLALFATMAMGSGMAAAQFTVGPSATPKSGTATTQAQGTIPSNSWTPTQIADAFRKTDADGDGRISRKEAQTSSGLASNFDKVDTNADGVLSRTEFEQSLK